MYRSGAATGIVLSFHCGKLLGNLAVRWLSALDTTSWCTKSVAGTGAHWNIFRHQGRRSGHGMKHAYSAAGVESQFQRRRNTWIAYAAGAQNWTSWSEKRSARFERAGLGHAGDRSIGVGFW